MRNPYKTRIFWFFAVWTAILINLAAACSVHHACRPYLCESSLQQDTEQDERLTRLVARTSSVIKKDSSISREKPAHAGRKVASSGGRSQSDISKHLIGLSDTDVFTRSNSKAVSPQNSREASPEVRRKRPGRNLPRTHVTQSAITDIQELRKLPRTDPRRPKSRLSPKLTLEENRERSRLRQKSARDAMTLEERANWNKKKSIQRAKARENMTKEQHSQSLTNRRARVNVEREEAREDPPSVRQQQNRARAMRARRKLQEDPERRFAYNARRRERQKELKEAERRGLPTPPGRARNQFSKEDSTDPSISSISGKNANDAGGHNSLSSPGRNFVATSHSSAELLLPQRQQEQEQEQQQVPALSQGSGGSIPGDVAAQDLFHQWRAEIPDSPYLLF